MNNPIYDILVNQLRKEGEISPFLFLSQEGEIFHELLLRNIHQILKENAVDAFSLFHLPDDGEKLKIEGVKKFISQGNIRSRQVFQVFLIENISRMTGQSQNACLKFFEEPGIGNIIILTDKSESGILETILSRVQIHSFYQKQEKQNNTFYETLITDYIGNKNYEIITYFFSTKLDKQNYVEFLKTLHGVLMQEGKYSKILEDLHEDIGGVLKNNLQGKYIVDKYIILLRK